MCEINVQILKVGDRVMYDGRSYKIYAIKEDKVLISPRAGVKRYIPVKDCQPCLK